MVAKRTFKLVSVTKPGQHNTQTKFDKSKLFTGAPRNAAMKAMTYLCSGKTKQIKGVCTFTVMVQEVKRHVMDGKMMLHPILDSANIPKIYKYKLKRIMYHDMDNETDNGPRVITFMDRDIPFKYHVKVIESYGRVI
jgi:hypothetical protein